MTKEHVELNGELMERLDRFKAEFEPFSNNWTYDEVIERALDKLDRLQMRYDELYETHEQDVAILLDACLISIQRDDRHDLVKQCKDALVRNVACACGNDEQTQLRMCYLAEEHNKTRRYDDAVFSWRG